MKKNIITYAAVTILALGIAGIVCAKPVYAEETETEDASSQGLRWQVSSEIEDGVLAIRIASSQAEVPEFWWQDRISDKGDASHVGLTMMEEEEGTAYCGYYKALEDNWEGDDTIRLVYTNGDYTAEYMEWVVSVKDGKITDVIGGSQAFPTSAEDLASVLQGTWKEENGTQSLTIRQGEDNSLEFTVLDENGNAQYLMHAFYDAEKEALVYRDAAPCQADASDDSENAAGTGIFGLLPLSEDAQDAQNIAVIWQDDTFGNNETGRFLKIGE